MNFSQRFTFLFSAPGFDAEDLEGLRVQQIIAAIERLGFQVFRARRTEDAEIAIKTDAAIGCLVADWGKKGLESKTASLINLMRRRGLEMPIVLLVRRQRFEDVPVEVLDFIDGYVFLAEETPEFIARNLVSRLSQYADTLKTPFFGALVDYAEEGNQLWTCPGHNGGIFYSRSPIGRIWLGIELRKKLRAVRREFERKEADPARRWFFDPFVPDVVRIPDAAREGAVHEIAWETVATDPLASHAHFWEIAPGDRWHGFTCATPGFAITDPNKLTPLTPGFDRTTGEYEAHGVPAPVVAQFLRENRVVPEKNDLNSLLFLLTPGVEASKAGTLVSALVAFKRMRDDNVLLDHAVPRFVAARPARYRGVRLRDLCAEMHGFCRSQNISALQKAQFASAHLPEPAMAPYEAARCLVRNDVDYLPIDEIEGRVAVILFVVYPPGIATIVPGERLGANARPMIDYLRAFERSSNLFSGFEAEIQGVYRETDAAGNIRFHTYVVRE
jgi:arginine/lysine/ornithine decarboxylase